VIFSQPHFKFDRALNRSGPVEKANFLVRLASPHPHVATHRAISRLIGCAWLVARGLSFLLISFELGVGVMTSSSAGNKRALTPSQSNRITNYISSGSHLPGPGVGKRPRTAALRGGGSSRPPLPPGSRCSGGGASSAGGTVGGYVAPSQTTQPSAFSQDHLPAAIQRGFAHS